MILCEAAKKYWCSRLYLCLRYNCQALLSPIVISVQLGGSEMDLECITQLTLLCAHGRGHNRPTPKKPLRIGKRMSKKIERLVGESLGAFKHTRGFYLRNPLTRIISSIQLS